VTVTYDWPVVVVAILTYRRPEDLLAVLPLLVREASSVEPHATVLVVDNDPDGGAEALVSQFADRGVRYVHEPTPGIAAARNCALSAASDARLLAFIDDDERPTEGWLKLLLEVWREHRCDAVVGPVVSEFDGPMTEWVAAGRFFDRRRLATGTVVEVAATNNLLLDLATVRRLGLQFDGRFGITGGSDTLFTRQLHRRGGRMVWCDEALVLDRVPASRLTPRWVLARAFRSGNSWTRTSLALADSVSGAAWLRLRMLGLGGVRVAGGVARWLLGLVIGDLSRQARGMRTLMRGAGMVSGAWGFAYSEYRRSAKPSGEVAS
jgi:hypothetical protein